MSTPGSSWAANRRHQVSTFLCYRSRTKKKKGSEGEGQKSTCSANEDGTGRRRNLILGIKVVTQVKTFDKIIYIRFIAIFKRNFDKCESSDVDLNENKGLPVTPFTDIGHPPPMGHSADMTLTDTGLPTDSFPDKGHQVTSHPTTDTGPRLTSIKTHQIK